MNLSDWMQRKRIDDQRMADLITTPDVRCDRTSVNRYRRGVRRPDWPVIERIKAVTGGAVTADDFAHVEAAE